MIVEIGYISFWLKKIGYELVNSKVPQGYVIYAMLLNVKVVIITFLCWCARETIKRKSKKNVKEKINLYI